MAKQLFANNASALLAASISDTDLTIQVASGYGALFPNPGAGEFFIVALENADGDVEFCKVSSRTTDLLTVPTGGRGQDGSTALSWVNGQTRVELRAHKGALDRFLQREGDVMSGNLDMDNNNIIDARLTGSWRGTNGQLVGTALRGTLDDSSNEVVVPNDGTRATAGGEKILVETDTALISAGAFDVGMIMLWFGSALSVPTGWKICDGTNSTPDLRDRFVVGAGSSYALNATGGAASVNTGAAGSHTHTGSVDDHVLTVDEIPSHEHGVKDSSSTGPSGTPGYVLGPPSDTGILNTKAAGGGQGHSHTLSGVSTASDHTHTAATLPPYRALYYIMYTG